MKKRTVTAQSRKALVGFNKSLVGFNKSLVGFNKALAWLFCVGILLFTSSSQAYFLSCDCARVLSPEQPCCCMPADMVENDGICCSSNSQGWVSSNSSSHSSSHLVSDCELCHCIGAAHGFDVVEYITSLPNTSGEQTDLHLETSLTSAVVPLIFDDKIDFDDSLSPSTAEGLLGTVVLTL